MCHAAPSSSRRCSGDAGYPAGVFQTILVEPDVVARVIADDRVRAVTLTGSPRAGASVAEQAGRHLKKSVLELGGSDPFIVLADADVHGCRSRGRRGAPDQQRPKLHRRQAVHRGRGGGGPVSRCVRRRARGSGRWVIRCNRAPMSGPRPGSICGPRCTARWSSRWRAGRASCSAAGCPRVRARSIRPHCSPRSTPGCRRSTRRRSAPWRR